MWPWGNSSKTANDHTQGALEPEKKRMQYLLSSLGKSHYL